MCLFPPSVEFVNSQVVVKGCEAPGYVIVSAARARIDSYTHMPIWHQGQLRSKSTWNGDIECMQVTHFLCLIKLCLVYRKHSLHSIHDYIL